MEGYLLAESLIKSLRADGMRLWVEDGRLRGKMASGLKVTPPMRDLCAQLQAVEKDAIRYLEDESSAPGAIWLKGITVDEAITVGRQIISGHAELIGKVIYHRTTGLCDLAYRPLEAC